MVDAYQLASGFVTPVLESPGLPIHHVGTGLIDHIRNRLRTLGGIIKLEDNWCPSLQRINDDSLLKMMCGARALTKREIRLANEFRLWARITTISDIAEEWGKEIPWERLNGDWRAEPLPHMTWPNLPHPTKAHTAAFRRCL